MTTLNPTGSLITRGFKVRQAPPGFTACQPLQPYPADITTWSNLTHINGGILHAVMDVLTGRLTAHANSSGTQITVSDGTTHLHLTTTPQLERAIVGTPTLPLLTALTLADDLLAPGSDQGQLASTLRDLHDSPLALTPASFVPSSTLTHLLLTLTALTEVRLMSLSDDSTIRFESGSLNPPRRDVSAIYRGEVITLAPSLQADQQASGDLIGRMTRWVKRGLNILLVGPTATFKTTDALTAATRAGAYIVMVGGRPGMEDRDLFGGIYPTSEGPEWIDGPVTEAFAKASSGVQTVLVLNELTRFEPLHLGAMIGALDDVSAHTARQMGITVPQDSPDRYYALRLPNGEVIHCPTQFLSVIGTTNIGSDYLTAQELDTALLRRFDRQEDVPYADEGRAVKMIESRCGNAYLAAAAYGLEVRTRSEVQGRGQDTEGLLQREMNPAISAALAQEAVDLMDEGLSLPEAFTQAATVTAVPFCVPRLTTGTLDPAARERLNELIAEIAQGL